MHFEVKPLPNVGAEVIGFDLCEPITETTKAELRSLWNDHALLLFRAQDIDPNGQIEFSRIFGPLEKHPLEVARSRDHPELFVLQNGGDNDATQTAFYGGEPIVGRLDWHMDLHYTGRPNHGALLCMVQVAEEGGLTGFGDLALAYDALDRETQQQLENLEVVYRFEMQRTKMRFVDLSGYQPGPGSPNKPSDIGFPDFPDAIYPAVVEHPISGRKVLEVVEQFLDHIVDPQKAGMSRDEADDLLRRLIVHIRRPEFHYFHAWETGDMILWDNWRVMHCTTGTKPGVKRVINRTTIEGNVTLGRQTDTTREATTP
jgi:taurine dioxygenase